MNTNILELKLNYDYTNESLNHIVKITRNTIMKEQLIKILKVNKQIAII